MLLQNWKPSLQRNAHIPVGMFRVFQPPSKGGTVKGAQMAAAMFGEGEAPDEPCLARHF